MNSFLCEITYGRIGPKVKAGQKWINDLDAKNPFINDDDCSNGYGFCTILKVKNNWVKYKWNFLILTETVNTFRWTHTLVSE